MIIYLLLLFDDVSVCYRMLTFLARIMNDNTLGVFRGIGIDEHTALLVSVDGSVNAVGVGECKIHKNDMEPSH